MSATVIDLLHQGRPNVVASYLVGDGEPSLVDCGPASCASTLVAGLADAGLELTDVRRLILTHIHLDHAGAAGTLVRRHPGLEVHVSEIGLPHLADPSRLEQSARRLYGDDFDRLWGELVPVPTENLHPLGDRVADLEAFPTPGHAWHHVSFIGPDGACYVGDATGVRVGASSFLAPASPPPEIDLEAWWATLDELERRAPTRFALSHFGFAQDPVEHLALMRERLAAWAERVRSGVTEQEFVEAAEEELRGGTKQGVADSYVWAGSFEQSYAGLKRYWDKKAAA
jgi:glyoxylase-like metal-dependent hydrolase (beta-lactamase superfamily II)